MCKKECPNCKQEVVFEEDECVTGIGDSIMVKGKHTTTRVIFSTCPVCRRTFKFGDK